MRSFAQKQETHLPGELGIWLFIFGELTIFAVLFLIFMYYKGLDPEVFRSSHLHMIQAVAAFNTLLMLTSSWLVANGMQAVRLGQNRLGTTMFKLAFLCGAGFCVVKYFEYSEKIRHGITLNTNHFFMCYYMFTGIHLMHVLLGMLMLFLMTQKLNVRVPEPNTFRFLEVGATFWHMVDLLWIILFALFYLVN